MAIPTRTDAQREADLAASREDVVTTTTTADNPRIYREGLFTQDSLRPETVRQGERIVGTPVNATLNGELAAFREALIRGDRLAEVLVSSLVASRRLPRAHTPDKAVAAYETLLRSALRSRTNPTTNRYDPNVGQSAAEMLETDLAYLAGLGGGGGGQRRPTRVVSERGYTAQQATQMARAAFRGTLGIEPTRQQINDYAAALMRAAAKNPVVTTYNADGSFQRTVGGFDERAWEAGYMAAQIPRETGQDLAGTAGVTQDLITRLEEDYGVKLTDTLRYRLTRQLLSGAIDQQAALETVKDAAKTKYGALSGDIDRGITVRAKADPFIRTMAEVWEMPESSITVDSPEIMSALSFTDDKGNVRMKTMAEFQEGLRSSAKWQQTTSARQEATQLADSILKAMGFVG